MRTLLLLVFSGISVDAAESCCVDEDIAEAFIPYATFSRSWPSEFPNLVSPSNFEFIGSSEGKEGRYVSVAWSTAMDVQLAHEAAAEALVDQDWLPLPENEGMQVRFERGFIPPRSLLKAGNRRFCRDQDGLLTIQTRSTSIGTVVTLSLSGQDHMSTCARVVASQTMQPDITGGLMKYLPALLLPDKVDASRGMGSGGGTDDAHASTVAQTNMPAADRFGPGKRTTSI